MTSGTDADLRAARRNLRRVLRKSRRLLDSEQDQRYSRRCLIKLVAGTLVALGLAWLAGWYGETHATVFTPGQMAAMMYESDASGDWFSFGTGQRLTLALDDWNDRDLWLTHAGTLQVLNGKTFEWNTLGAGTWSADKEGVHIRLKGTANLNQTFIFTEDRSMELLLPFKDAPMSKCFYRAKPDDDDARSQGPHGNFRYNGTGLSGRRTWTIGRDRPEQIKAEIDTISGIAGSPEGRADCRRQVLMVKLGHRYE